MAQSGGFVFGMVVAFFASGKRSGFEIESYFPFQAL